MLLGVGVLGDLALVQLVGTIVGAASSVLLATPIVVDLAMRDKRWAAQAEKVAARRAKNARRTEGGDGAEAAANGPSTDVLDTREVAAAGAGARSSGARRRRRPGRGPASRCPSHGPQRAPVGQAPQVSTASDAPDDDLPIST